MKHDSRAAIGAVLLAGATQARAQDLYVNYFDLTPRIEKRASDGTLLWTTSGGTGGGWLGPAVSASGELFLTHRTPGIALERFDSSGAFVAEWSLPQIGATQGDIDVFADGTLAVCDWSSGVVALFSQSGSYVSTIQHTTLPKPFGCYIDSQDHLWVCNLPGGQSGKILTFDRSGALLQTFTVNYAAGDLVTDPSGDVWVIAGDSVIHHLTSSGVEISSFTTGLIGDSYGIARLDDGTLWTAGYGDSSLRHFSASGALLGSFVAPTSHATFLRADRPCGAPTNYCTAGTSTFGCVGHLSAAGTPSASGATSFTISASGVDGLKQGLIYYGITGALSSPWGVGGTSYSCVHPPWQRSLAANSGGTYGSCNGAYVLDWNAFFASHPGALGAPLQSSATFYAQAWWRDPAAPKASSLSDALSFVLCP